MGVHAWKTSCIQVDVFQSYLNFIIIHVTRGKNSSFLRHIQWYCYSINSIKTVGFTISFQMFTTYSAILNLQYISSNNKISFINFMVSCLSMSQRIFTPHSVKISTISETKIEIFKCKWSHFLLKMINMI